MVGISQATGERKEFGTGFDGFILQSAVAFGCGGIRHYYCMKETFDRFLNRHGKENGMNVDGQKVWKGCSVSVLHSSMTLFRRSTTSILQCTMFLANLWLALESSCVLIWL